MLPSFKTAAFAFLVCFYIFLGKSICVVSSPNGDTLLMSRVATNTKANMTADNSDILIVFSDLDGTLIHYPANMPNYSESHSGNRILELPPSATGLKGVISSRTLSRCRDLRKAGIKLVLVSGMRTSTLLKRLPYLPKADAYCTEV
jgi:hypothetical protein